MADAPPLAIVAGTGALPRLIAEAAAEAGRTYRVVRFRGVELDWTAGHPVIEAEFEKPGALFKAFRAAGIREVVLAGAMRRPEISPRKFDLTAMRIAPKVLGALKGGDDAGLRAIAAVLESEGLSIVSADGLVGDLTAPAGVLTAARPTEADRADIARAGAILDALGAADVGQGAVVAQGVCLGLETVQGTDAMLRFVAETATGFRPDPEGARGVLVKRPKPGQDRRVDLPAIGPETVEGAAAAGLAGIAVPAGGALILDRAVTLAAADRHGLFVVGEET